MSNSFESCAFSGDVGHPPGFREEQLEPLGCPISRVFCEKWGPPISTTLDLREKRFLFSEYPRSKMSNHFKSYTFIGDVGHPPAYDNGCTHPFRTEREKGRAPSGSVDGEKWWATRPSTATPAELRSACTGETPAPTSRAYIGRARAPVPTWPVLATPARAPATSAPVAASIPRHDGSAEAACRGVAQVDESGESVGGVD
jgi:hypothetical protein